MYLGAYLRFLHVEDPLRTAADSVGALVPRAIVFAVVMFLIMLAMGLYQSQRRDGFWGMVSRLSAAYIVASIILGVIFYLIPSLSVWRGVYLLSAFFSFVSIILIRTAFASVLDKDLLRRKILIYGAGEQAKWILSLRRKSDRRGIDIVGFIPVAEENIEVPSERVIQLNQKLDEFALENGIDLIVMACGERRGHYPNQALINCRFNGIEILELSSFLERQMAKVYVQLIDPSWIIFSEEITQAAYENLFSRLFDIFASVILLIFTLPLLILTILAIWIEGKGKSPIFYQQLRGGQNNEVFKLLKFRSMHIDAEPDATAVWAAKNDARITAVGKIIRKYRIDELPQVINIIKGDMSLVGPRPERPQFVEALAKKSRITKNVIA